MKKVLNTRIMHKASLKEKIHSIADAGFDAVEIWQEEIDCPREARKLIEDCGLRVSSLEKLDGWFERDGGLMGVPVDQIDGECRRRMEIAAEVNSPYIICCPSFSHRGFSVELEEGVERFSKLLEFGDEFGVEPLIEFMGQTGQINTLSKCVDFLNRLDRPARMVVDAYHVWRGGDTMSVLDSIDLSQVALLHVSDANDNVERQSYRDRDRVLPGDGIIDLEGFFRRLEGFDGDVALGVYNPLFWNRDPHQVAQQAYERLAQYV